MELLQEIGDEKIARVYIGKTYRGNIVEFVESVPTYNITEKWVLIVSSLNGCPVGCKMCDAGFFYKGKLTKQEILEQVEYPIMRRFGGTPRTKKFKVQFARMGEPSFNPAVLDAIEELGSYPNFYPSLSTVAPMGVDAFFERLKHIKKKKYPHKFQLQFSIHTTDDEMRDKLIPVKKWDFERIAKYGEEFYDAGGLKITLNFALAKENKVEADVLREHFSPDLFLVKITPINPTVSSTMNGITNDVDLRSGLPQKHREFIDKLKKYGYRVIISIGDTRENEIGSNCGMFILKYLKEKPELLSAYTFAKNLQIKI
ncbi:MAG: radical SAM protein [Euryarchaeota archaeon]|nr:radical SAM protein [Euryarchaeota archaeon]